MSLKFWQFQNSEPQSPFAPRYRYIGADAHIEDIDFPGLAKMFLDCEEQMLRELPATHDGGTGLGLDSITSRFLSYNPLTWTHSDEIMNLREKIYTLYLEFHKTLKIVRQPMYLQCWANIVRPGQQINLHLHDISEYSYLSGNLLLQGSPSVIEYHNPQNCIIKPEPHRVEQSPGQITIFQSCIPHQVPEYTGTEPRVSLSFDFLIREYVLARVSRRNQRCIKPWDMMAEISLEEFDDGESLEIPWIRS
jgi:hypothetical protein